MKNPCNGLIFAKVAGKKPAILLNYESTDVLQGLNLDDKNTFFPQQLLVTASVYQAGE